MKSAKTTNQLCEIHFLIYINFTTIVGSIIALSIMDISYFSRNGLVLKPLACEIPAISPLFDVKTRIFSKKAICYFGRELLLKKIIDKVNINGP